MADALGSARRPWFDRAVMPISFALACAIMAVVAYTLWQARQDAWTLAIRYGQSLARALQNDIGRNIERYDLAMQDMSDAHANPLALVTPEARQSVLFDRTAGGVASVQRVAAGKMVV
jgi:hypothetical protein